MEASLAGTAGEAKVGDSHGARMPCPHLAPVVDGDVLYLDRLFAGRAVFFESFDLNRKGASRFVQHGRGAALLGNSLDVV